MEAKFATGDTLCAIQPQNDLGNLEDRIIDLCSKAAHIGVLLTDIGNGVYGARPEANGKDPHLETAPNGRLDAIHRALDTLSGHLAVISTETDRLRQIA